MIEKLKLKNQPKFREFKYICLIYTGPVNPKKGSTAPQKVEVKYAKSEKQVKEISKQALSRGMKMHVFKGNFDFVMGFEYK